MRKTSNLNTIYCGYYGYCGYSLVLLPKPLQNLYINKALTL